MSLPFDAHITFLYTTDPERSARFYEQTLGLRLALDQGRCRIYHVAGDAYLGICEQSEPPATDGVLLTLVAADVDGWCARLQAQGVTIERRPRFNPEFGIYHCFFRDPNGYRLEIQRFEDPRWGSDKGGIYAGVFTRVQAVVGQERDAVAVMSTVACELFQAFAAFSWVGFYRVCGDRVLKVGPYQGGHGCVEVRFDRGVCGACARSGETQVVNDVTSCPHHIACSHKTRSEIVVPVHRPNGDLLAVLDVDSEIPDCFDEVDRHNLEAVAGLVGRQIG